MEAGPALGTYVFVTGGHKWKNYDDWEAKLGAPDEADFNANMGPYIAAESNVMWVYLDDVSRPADLTTPTKYIEVVHFMTKQDKAAEFSLLIEKIHEAIAKTNWPAH